MSASPQTSTPVNGWVVVPAPTPAKADGYVLFTDTDHPNDAWPFLVVNVSGTSEQAVTCSKLCEAIAEFAFVLFNRQAAMIQFHEPIAERLVLPASYPIPS